MSTATPTPYAQLPTDVDLSSAIDTLCARMRTNPEEFAPDGISKFGWVTAMALAAAAAGQARVPSQMHAVLGGSWAAATEMFSLCLSDAEISKLAAAARDIYRNQFNTLVMGLVLSNNSRLQVALSAAGSSDMARAASMLGVPFSKADLDRLGGLGGLDDLGKVAGLGSAEMAKIYRYITKKTQYSNSIKSQPQVVLGKGTSKP